MSTAVNPLVPLILACKRGSPSQPGDPVAAQALLDACVANPALINTRCNASQPGLPLDNALYWGLLPAVQSLTQAGVATGTVPKAVEGGPLGQAAFSTNPTLVQWVWDTNLDRALVPEVGVKALAATQAVDAERMAVVQFLIGKGLVVSEDMAVLAVRGQPAIAAYLVTSGALNTATLTAIEPKTRPADNPLGFALLPDRTNDLYVAIHSGVVANVTSTLDAGSPINVLLPGASRLGTPLHYACFLGKADIATLLLSRGADPALLSSWGQSIVGAAAVSGSTPTLHVALAAVPPSAIDAVERKPSGRNTTPLVASILAMVPNVVQAVKDLLAAGADPNTTATVGTQPAFWPSYQLMDVHAAAAAGFTGVQATAIIKALEAGNSKGQKADLNLWNATVRNTPRGLAASVGLVV